MTPKKSDHHGNNDVLLSAKGAILAQRPETYRLPKAGGDPFFGLGRSFYYRGEQLGYWRLLRIRERGKMRGVTLVPYDAVAKFIRSQMEGSAQ